MDQQLQLEEDVNTLIDKIERLRKELYQLVGEEFPTDFNQEQIYWLSERLDKLIVQFMRQDKKQQKQEKKII
jgi:regulator of replication initiation timing